MAAKPLGDASIQVTSRLYGQVDASDLKAACDRFLSTARDGHSDGDAAKRLHEKLLGLVQKGELRMEELVQILSPHERAHYTRE
jgi:hypothetical protein